MGLIYVGENRTWAQAEMLAKMVMRQRERLEGWTVELVDEFPPLTSIHTRAILGMFAWSMPHIKHKLIVKDNAVNIGGGWVTPGDIARDYLALKFEKRRARMTGRQWRENVQGKTSPPLYCVPGSINDAVYIDLSGAYWNIVRAVGWDVNYCPMRFLSPQTNVDDFPVPEIKMARNCLVSVGLPGTMRVWENERLTFQKKPNRFINLMLYRLVCDVLNGVAEDAIREGAAYVYTDGYIVQRTEALRLMSVIERWGLPYSIKHEGRAEIRGPADYTIGGYKTRSRGHRREKAIDKIKSIDNEWLRPRVALFADKSNERFISNV